MKSLEKVIENYNEAIKNVDNIHDNLNSEIKEAFRIEYIRALPLNKRLAIHLHGRMCNSNHIDQCSFYYGICGIEDDWMEYAHKKYLKKSDNIISYIKETFHTEDEDKIFNTVNKIVDLVR